MPTTPTPTRRYLLTAPTADLCYVCAEPVSRDGAPLCDVCNRSLDLVSLRAAPPPHMTAERWIDLLASYSPN